MNALLQLLSKDLGKDMHFTVLFAFIVLKILLQVQSKITVNIFMTRQRNCAESV